MPAATPLPIRAALWRAAQADPDADTAALAAQFGLPERTARHLLRSFRAGAGPHPPRYRAGGASADADHVAYVVALRRDHPRWGAGVLRVHLARRFPGAALPHPRTIQRWLARAGLAPAPAGRRRGPRAGAPHDAWQIDAADQIALASGQLVSWLRVTDEHSGAVLLTRVFPLRLEPRAGRDGARRGA
jgi:hypothetical protein